jgi:hypothetical protein
MNEDAKMLRLLVSRWIDLGLHDFEKDRAFVKARKGEGERRGGRLSRPLGPVSWIVRLICTDVVQSGGFPVAYRPGVICVGSAGGGLSGAFALFALEPAISLSKAGRGEKRTLAKDTEEPPKREKQHVQKKKKRSYPNFLFLFSEVL